MSQYNRVVRFLVIEAICLIFSLLFVVLIGLGAINLAEYIYNIPAPVLGEDDLGVGIVVAIFIFCSFFISAPLAICIHFYVFSKFFKGDNK